MSTIVLDDPDMDCDIDGHRGRSSSRTSPRERDDVLCSGYIADQEIGREGGEAEPLGRSGRVSITDANTVWQRRIMVGADCNRPAETDVERVAVAARRRPRRPSSTT